VATEAPPAPSVTEPETPVQEGKDLSFLLDPSIYHSLSQLEVPAPFRRPFSQYSGKITVEESLTRLETLLSQCDFLRAAQLAGSILTSGLLQPTDDQTIFHLLAVRYSCLELSGNVLLAAQEAKALEDLSSAFYYDDPGAVAGAPESLDDGRSLPRHIVPFPLRLQALRLQSIGFSDPRRGVSSLYDVGLECRKHLSSLSTPVEERRVWESRLEEMGVRVVNALIEMGEVDGARRALAIMKPAGTEDVAIWTSRMILLHIRMGDLLEAQKLLDDATLKPEDSLFLGSLLAIAEGRYDDAAETLSQTVTTVDPNLKALVQQNLAVAYLYIGEGQKAKAIMEELVDDQHSFQTLTINLATLYDLSSDRSRDLKAGLASRIASQRESSGQLYAFTNADFKL